MARHGLLETHEAENILSWNHGGGFSLDATVRIEATDRAGLERLIRYCARPPFALERLHFVGGCSDRILYLLPDPDPAGRIALRLAAHSLPAQVPLPSPTRAAQKPKSPADPRFPPFSPPRSRWAALLARIDEILPLTCPSCQTPITFIALLTDPEPIAQDDLGQTPVYDPTEPDPIPDDDFDQTRSD